MLFFSLTNNLLYFSVTENLIHSNGWMTVNVFLVVWQVTHERGHVTPDSWHLTPHTWHVTADTWHLTPDLFLSFFYNFFKDIFMSVLLTKQDVKFSVSHMRDFSCLGKSARKKHWIREHAHTSLRPTPPPPSYCDRLRLFSFSAVFGLFGMLGKILG